MNRRGFLAGSSATFVAIVGCTVGEDFRSPEKDLPEQFFTSNAVSSGARGRAKWWLAYQDPKLNRLTEIGLEQNLDVKRTLARIEQSRAIYDGAGYPISGATRVAEIKASGGGEDGRSDSGFVRAEASWQLDLFGRLTREREAANYRLEAAFADANVARTTLLSELAIAYIDARFFQELIRINHRVLQSREQTLSATEQARSIVVARKGAENGAEPDENVPEVTELEVAQARSLVATARAELPESKILFFKSVSRVGALLGQAWDRPREGLDKNAPQPVPKITDINTGIPADLVRSRPDVIQAEKKLAEAVALVGLAEAELYPELILTGNINANYSDGAFVPIAGFGRLGLDIPLFDLPERRSRVRYQKARVDEFRLLWEEEIINAVEEVQDSLVSLKNHKEAMEFTAQAIEELRTVLDLARKSYIAGNTSFLQVLDAERALLAAENALALDKRNFAVDFVDLNVALGGNYS
ncbi:MAG: efflux transporter outer membrane subunit [Pseudoruegeria sp.]